MTFGTICAGSESPALVLSELSQAMGGRLNFSHLYSPEMNEEKRKFIEKVFPNIPCMFGEVQDLKEKKAISYHMQNTKHIAKAVPETEVKFMGFPCKDVSTLNKNRKDMADVVEQGGSKTGSAFQGGLDCIDKHGDKLIIIFLENVLGLHQKTQDNKLSNLEVCQLELKKRNFASFVLQLDPRCVAGCQSRGRFWIPCVRISFLESLGSTEAAFRKQLCDCARRFSGFAAIPIDNILLPDHDPLVLQHLRKASLKNKVKLVDDYEDDDDDDDNDDEGSASERVSVLIACVRDSVLVSEQA